MPRAKRIGGGVGVFVSRKYTNIKMKDRNFFDSFEILEIHFNSKNKKMSVVVIYRPPDANLTRFINEFGDYLDTFDDELRWTYFCGDFNIWIDSPRDNNERGFIELIESLNLENIVCQHTSRSGHILDLIIGEKENNQIGRIEVEPDHTLSYFHKLVTFELRTNEHSEIFNRIIFRDKKKLDPYVLIENSIKDIKKRVNECRCNLNIGGDCLNCFTQLYREVFFKNYNDMCPVIEINKKIRNAAPWFNTELRKARKLRRMAELRWRRKRTIDLREKCRSARNEVNSLIRRTKREYFHKKIHKAGTNMEKLYKFFNELTGKNKKKILPEGFTDSNLANSFADYFEEKIEKIYNNFEDQGRGYYSLLPDFPFRNMTKLEPIDYNELRGLVKRTKKTYCDSDPFPISEIEASSNFDEVMKIYHRIVNMSLTKSMFPSSEKFAYVKPTIKSKLDQQSLSSYRPVSNLSFLSKITETIVKEQLINHLEKINVLPGNQSAYRKNHSTETALCSVLSDLLKMVDDGKCGILVLLDLSAAFDTVVHEFLLEDLVAVGVTDDALKWFKSYLSGREFCVSIAREKSEHKKLNREVPQGSVLGPILFTIYTTELSWILVKHKVKFKFFADDTQFYFVVDSGRLTVLKINDIMAEIILWMNKKRLKLNEGKTECLLIGTRQALVKLEHLKTININNMEIILASSVRNLGVIFDQQLTLKENVLNVVRITNYHIRNIAFIKMYLDKNSLKMLVNNYVITRLDYCNSLYYKLPAYLLKRIQGIFNRAARLIVNKPQ